MEISSLKSFRKKFMNIGYTVKRSRKRRKTLSLQISNNAEVVVSALYFTPVREINSFVQEKQNWIQKTIKKQKEESLQKQEKEYISGEEFYYLGKQYHLEVFFQQNEPERLVFWGDRFYLNTVKGRAKRKDFFVGWYKIKAREYLCERVESFSRQLGLFPNKVKVTSAERRWGSCSEDNNISFSFRLMMTPPAVIDYVIVHELMHIKEKSHSARFWKLIEAVMPEYKMHRRWLKKDGEKFVL
jgi:predicted metal-dependent hydrolase